MIKYEDTESTYKLTKVRLLEAAVSSTAPHYSVCILHDLPSKMKSVNGTKIEM